MLIAEYDYATDIAVQKQEAWDQAVAETWDKASRQTARNMLKEGYDLDSIARCTGVPLENIKHLQKN